MTDTNFSFIVTVVIIIVIVWLVVRIFKGRRRGCNSNERRVENFRSYGQSRDETNQSRKMRLRKRDNSQLPFKHPHSHPEYENEETNQSRKMRLRKRDNSQLPFKHSHSHPEYREARQHKKMKMRGRDNSQVRYMRSHTN